MPAYGCDLLFNYGTDWYLSSEIKRLLQRERILKAATELFLKEGFDRISVEKIATQARVSKTAIYKQFGGKDPLFDAVVGYSCEGVDAPALAPLGDDFDLRDALKVAGKALAYRILQPKTMSIMRLVMGAHNLNPRLGQLFWQHGPVHGAHFVSEALSREKKRRRLRKLNPHDLATEFMNEVLGPFLFTVALGVSPYPKKSEIDKSLDRVVEEFLLRHNLSE